MNDAAPQPIFAKDYIPHPYRIERVRLDIALDPAFTRVRASMRVRRQAAADANLPLVLDGEAQQLLSVHIDGNLLPEDAYVCTEQSLTIVDPPSDLFEIEIETGIDPSANRALEGLYLSNDMYCTQCEAEGFRRITYFIDRPDNLALFTTRITGDRESCPVLLSNGNLVASGVLDDGRHWAEWSDPYPKPSYLFALVAGDLACVQDRFLTASGREVDLRIYVEQGMQDRCDYAMDALKRAMRWDETRFGLEYDLDIYMIVAVSHFNMGAMENKGLNIFNAKYVLARPDTATDADYEGIERVIAHEYFHNWTGNRVTCRDWFQLSLKEGLTVFRDQEFSADMRAAAVQRINDVQMLRARQFAEDAGPLAHPVQPDSYIEVNNFYTATVYEKGAEIVRMIHSLLGEEKFADGLRTYLSRHDGTAATVEDFVAAMEQAGSIDLSRFRHWYHQAGTPHVTAAQAYDPERQTLVLKLSQHTPPTPGQTEKPPMQIPVRMGLVDKQSGAPVPLSLFDGAAEGVLSLEEASQTFEFSGVSRPAVASLFRGFSAPVILSEEEDGAVRALRAEVDPDPFNRWQAVQQLAMQQILDQIARIQDGATVAFDGQLIAAIGSALKDRDSDKAFIAKLLAMPGEQEVAQHLSQVDAAAVHKARYALRREIATALRAELETIYHDNRVTQSYRPDPQQAGQRALRNGALGLLAALETPATNALVDAHYRSADNMTDAMAALGLLANLDIPERDTALADFHARWRDDPLVLDKWYMVQAQSRLPDTLDRVAKLRAAPEFEIDNPNRVRALIGAFCHGNPLHFHAPDGSGYRFFADQVLALNGINAQIAARLLTAIDQWRRYMPACQTHARAALERIVAAQGLTRDVYEIASKTLDAPEASGS